MGIPAWFLNSALVVEDLAGEVWVVDPETLDGMPTGARMPAGGVTSNWVISRAIEYWAAQELIKVGLDPEHSRGEHDLTRELFESILKIVEDASGSANIDSDMAVVQAIIGHLQDPNASHLGPTAVAQAINYSWSVPGEGP